MTSSPCSWTVEVLRGRRDGHCAGGHAEGEKVVLDFVQTATENERLCVAFLRGLLERGLRVDQGPLCLLDGAKGLRKAIQALKRETLGLLGREANGA